MYCIVGKVHPRSVCVVNLQQLPEHWETEKYQFIAAIFETLCPPYSSLTLNDLIASSLLRYQWVWNHLEDIKGYQITWYHQTTYFFSNICQVFQFGYKFAIWWWCEVALSAVVYSWCLCCFPPRLARAGKQMGLACFPPSLPHLQLVSADSPSHLRGFKNRLLGSLVASMLCPRRGEMQSFRVVWNLWNCYLIDLYSPPFYHLRVVFLLSALWVQPKKVGYNVNTLVTYLHEMWQDKETQSNYSQSRANTRLSKMLMHYQTNLISFYFVYLCVP